MSKKRTAAESNNDEQTTEGSDSVSQQQNDAKRAKFVSLSDTTLQDLPIEVLECILFQVVVMEVKSMGLAKSVWKEKADLVINRLRTVCSRWNNICATDFLRTQIHRTLDGTAQETIRFEILYQYPIKSSVIDMTTMKDEIFLLRRPRINYVINVHDCNNVSEVKDVIRLPRSLPSDIAACSVSNCVYVLNVASELYPFSQSDSILRITKDAEHQFNILPWITIERMSLFTISVSANGSLITLSRPRKPNPTVSIYAANGSLQHKVVLSPDIHGVTSVIQKSNGNLVLLSNGNQSGRQLIEIDTTGSFVRRYQSAFLGEYIVMNFADTYGRIFIANLHNRFELLDSELNLLDCTGRLPHEGKMFFPDKVHFNSERNEIMCMYKFLFPTASVLDIFSFIKE